ncbi:hypothetical protein POM88_052505 [Heracleum sosnowskyi]|uniref:Uncharacterized protein n=1 Tax=Heracleum sosnowskyi TaxID=360622 RepID=A0AAD8LWN3_9APIA|nr:hypothetical protein POM88_052505 [Heracleum sosnowskyi]
MGFHLNFLPEPDRTSVIPKQTGNCASLAPRAHILLLAQKRPLRLPFYNISMSHSTNRRLKCIIMLKALERCRKYAILGFASFLILSNHLSVVTLYLILFLKMPDSKVSGVKSSIMVRTWPLLLILNIADRVEKAANEIDAFLEAVINDHAGIALNSGASSNNLLNNLLEIQKLDTRSAFLILTMIPLKAFFWPFLSCRICCQVVWSFWKWHGPVICTCSYLGPFDMRKPDLDAKIAKQLRKFHQVEVPASNLGFDDNEKCKKYETVKEIHTELVKLKVDNMSLLDDTIEYLKNLEKKV